MIKFKDIVNIGMWILKKKWIMIIVLVISIIIITIKGWDDYKRYIYKVEREQQKLEQIEQLHTDAELGNAEAQYNLGVNYNRGGYGFTKNEKTGVKWIKKAAEQGLGKAQSKLSKMYSYGWGVAVNKKEARKWYIKALKENIKEYIKNGTPIDRLSLHVQIERDGDGSAMFAQYQKDAIQGNSEAQYTLGLMYGNYNYSNIDTGIKKNPEAALQWLQKAAKQSHIPAQLQLSGWYDRGQLVSKNREKALEWYNKAYTSALLSAVQDDWTAQLALESMYSGVGLFPKKAYKKMIKELGLSVVLKKDYTQMVTWMHKYAAEWYYKAFKSLLKEAEQSNEKAYLQLASLYNTEKGGTFTYRIERNEQEARKWYLKGIESLDLEDYHDLLTLREVLNILDDLEKPPSK